MRHNYYETQAKHHLAQSILLLICAALTKAAKLGKDGAEMFDSLQITMIDAVSKRNAFMAELDDDQAYNTQAISQAIREQQDRENRAAFLAQDKANADRYAAERKASVDARAKVIADDIADALTFSDNDTDEAV